MTTAGLAVEQVIRVFFGKTNYVTLVMTTVEEVSQRANKHSHARETATGSVAKYVFHGTRALPTCCTVETVE